MAMSFHLLVRFSGPLRAQDGSPLRRPQSEMNDGRSEAMLGLVDPRRAGSAEAVQRIVRVFGFGIQNAQRSILSGENDAFFSLAK